MQNNHNTPQNNKTENNYDETHKETQTEMQNHHKLVILCLFLYVSCSSGGVGTFYIGLLVTV